MSLQGAVLTGGRSTRMGRDKALVEVAGRPLALVAAEALRGAGAAEVLAIGGDLAALGAMGLRAVPDRFPGDGPLGGVATALAAATADVVVVVACDLPWLTAATVAEVVAGLGDALVAVARTDRVEPLCGAWRRAECAPVVTAMLAEGERAVRAALDRLGAVEVPASDAGSLRNANEPDDLPGGSAHQHGG